jgi:hypothetical protein
MLVYYDTDTNEILRTANCEAKQRMGEAVLDAELGDLFPGVSAAVQKVDDNVEVEIGGTWDDVTKTMTAPAPTPVPTPPPNNARLRELRDTWRVDPSKVTTQELFEFLDLAGIIDSNVQG